MKNKDLLKVGAALAVSHDLMVLLLKLRVKSAFHPFSVEKDDKESPFQFAIRMIYGDIFK